MDAAWKGAAARPPAELGTDEILAWVIGEPAGGGRAGTMLRRAGSLGRVLAVWDRRLVGELGPAACLQLELVREAGLRAAREAVLGRPFEAGSQATATYLRCLMAFASRESFRVIFLDAAGLWLADEELGRGTVDHAPVYPREVLARALELGAAGVVLVHNHPSGDPTPSAADVEMTQQVALAGAGLGVAVVDHLVVGVDGIAGFRALVLL